MTGKSFYWVAVFETITAIEVPQRDDAAVNQAVTQKWNRSGTVNISPGQYTEDVVKNIVTQCKEGGGVPADALLSSISMLPNVLVPR